MDMLIFGGVSSFCCSTQYLWKDRRMSTPTNAPWHRVQAIDPSFHPPEIFKVRREAVRFPEILGVSMVIFWHYRFMITHVACMDV